MTEEVRKRIEDINNGIVPNGYKQTKTGVFPVEWEELKLGDLFYKVTERNNGQFDNTRWISVAKMYFQEPEKVTSNNLDTRTYVMRLGDMAFEGHPNKEFLFGRFVVNDIGDGIISELFPIYRHKTEQVSLYWKYAIQFESVMARIYSRCITMSGASSNKINDDEFVKERICVPSKNEQKKIAEILSIQDELINFQEQKVEKLKNQRKAYLTKMFPQKGQKKPELRFQGFTDDWEQRKLGEMMNVTSVKRIHQSDWTSSGVRFLRARDIVAAYKNEEPSDYLYISQEKYNEYSSLSGRVKAGDLLVTGVGTIGVPMLINDENPLYFKDGNIIWFQNENKINGDFLYYSFIGNAIQSFIQESAGTGTVGTYTIDSGKKTPIALPKDMTEQKQIGSYFRNLDHLITLHQRKLEVLKKKKKALMQLLLTGKVRFKV